MHLSGLAIENNHHAQKVWELFEREDKVKKKKVLYSKVAYSTSVI